MRGPYWDGPQTGVTGEPAWEKSYKDTHPHVQTYVDETGKTRTRILPKDEA